MGYYAATEKYAFKEVLTDRKNDHGDRKNDHGVMLRHIRTI